MPAALIIARSKNSMERVYLSGRPRFLPPPSRPPASSNPASFPRPPQPPPTAPQSAQRGLRKIRPRFPRFPVKTGEVLRPPPPPRATPRLLTEAPHALSQLAPPPHPPAHAGAERRTRRAPPQALRSNPTNSALWCTTVHIPLSLSHPPTNRPTPSEPRSRSTRNNPATPKIPPIPQPKPYQRLTPRPRNTMYPNLPHSISPSPRTTPRNRIAAAPVEAKICSTRRRSGLRPREPVHSTLSAAGSRPTTASTAPTAVKSSLVSRVIAGPP
jgi:hypothetical protein